MYQARRETGKDMDDEIKAKATKLNASIDNLKECTSKILAQVAALEKVVLCDVLMLCDVMSCHAMSCHVCDVV